MTTRMVGLLRRLMSWYGTPSGLAYIVALCGVVCVALFVSGRWGVVTLAGVVAIFVPMKLMHLEHARIDAHHSLRQAADAVRGLTDRTDKLEALAARGDAMATKGDLQATRADAMAAIDTARYEWGDILRAERRTTKSFVRSSLAEQPDERPSG